MKEYKYNVKPNTVGVYMITCTINNKKYVGSSNNVSSRIGQHFRKKVCLKYEHLPLYSDILKFGVNNFNFELLEETTKDNKISREKYYYDVIQPEYNSFSPVENMFQYKVIRDRGQMISNSPENINKRKRLYNTKEYKLKFREIGNRRAKRIEMYSKDNSYISSFKSIRECERWLNDNTDFKSKSKASKIIEVCKGTRQSAFGYKYKYSK